MTADEFDEMFDSGAVDMTPYLDFSQMRRPNQELRKIEIDLPRWLLNSVDAEVKRSGMARSAVVASRLATSFA
ncbi:hypothetical protein FACS1894139_09340 [Planctomycetales bacterium]|nr:hypothetical protein FACS1894107_07260 [Planctomycetales bacterium]GHT05472.1 hypothetical protein FACS1894139_09340 [Planctomycetales bacterium]GHV23527.1 hypothetical protein AGMMS49959_16840 [Planctomycetales bacterium]